MNEQRTANSAYGAKTGVMVNRRYDSVRGCTGSLSGLLDVCDEYCIPHAITYDCGGNFPSQSAGSQVKLRVEAREQKFCQQELL